MTLIDGGFVPRRVYSEGSDVFADFVDRFLQLRKD